MLDGFVVTIWSVNSKEIAIVGGIATIIAAATAAERSRRWKDIHKLAAFVGLAMAIAGFLA
jgi:hypothetical protein